MPVVSRVGLLVTGLLAMSLLAACGGSKHTCETTDEPYLAARTDAQLRIPEGLTRPDGSSALVVPDVKPGGQAAGSGCLADAPSYFRSSGTVARSPEEVVASWAQAWASREADAVLALYSTSFVAPTDTAGSAAWLEQRREQIATGPVPEPMIENLKVDQDGADRRVASFVQKFGTNSLRKELTMVRESNSWRIAAEKVVDVK
ncbi:MAG: hypothetical protein ABW106_10710 [Steroidobacteraceae bacterium]